MLANEEELRTIFDKLLKDGFARTNTNSELVNMGTRAYTPEFTTNPRLDRRFYVITFEGKVLLDLEGGYSGRFAKEMSLKTQMNLDAAIGKRNERYLIAGTVGSAFFAASYLIWDIVKSSYHEGEIPECVICISLWLVIGSFSALLYFLIRKLP